LKASILCSQRNEGGCHAKVSGEMLLFHEAVVAKQKHPTPDPEIWLSLQSSPTTEQPAT